MYNIKQKFFDDFNCIADKCPENCCQMWQVMIDDDSLNKYESLIEKDSHVKAGIDVKEECFAEANGKCFFQEPSGLCYLQKNYGEAALCKTCTDYPRHMEEFENVREYSLSISCPVEAERLIKDKTPMEFITWEDSEEEEYEEFDYLLYEKLDEARKVLFKIAQDRSMGIVDRLNAIEEFGRILQELLDDDRLFDMDDVIEEWKDKVPPVPEGLSKQDEMRAYSVLFEMEKLHKDWYDDLDCAWEKIFKGQGFTHSEDYFESHAIEIEQLLMFFIFTYFCGAVYDDWIYSKVCLSVYSVKWIMYLAISKGGSTEALINATYKYAREIEHSQFNLDILEEWFSKQI